jgi:hypothetical protein
LNTNAPRLLAFATALLMGTSAQAAVIIGSGKTRHMSCSAGVCTPTSKKATLNAGDLAGMLASGDVIVTTGSGAVSIAVTDSFSWTSTHRLTLGAQQSVSFRAPVEVAGSGAVTITSGAGAAPVFFPGGSVDFWDTSSSLIVNGAPYTLVKDIHTLSADVAANQSGLYALAGNYDASVDGGYFAPPLNTLSGTLEGLGHTITKFRARNRATGIAFIVTIDTQGVVRNLDFTRAQVAATKHFAASTLALTNDGLISAVNVEAKVNSQSGESPLAGLVIENDGTIEGCSVSGSVGSDRANIPAAGLVFDNKGLVTNSHASSAVRGVRVAGFAYANQAGATISLSSATGSVSAVGHVEQGNLTGGFVISNDGSIDRSFATGDVSGGSDASGYAPFAGGFVTYQGNANATVTNSYATGSVRITGQGLVGGFTYDSSESALTSSWSSGAVSAPNAGGAQGFMGSPSTSASNDYWDTDTAGVSTGCDGSSCPGVTGLTTAQFQSGLPAGFDPAVWAESPGVNNGFPYLIDNPPQ